MIYIVAKQNIGSPRTFTRPNALAGALRKAGARDVSFRPDNSIVVEWPVVGEVVYKVDAEGRVDEQLAWDLEP